MTGPYATASTGDLVDAIERDHDQGRPLNPEIVFELAGRALAAETRVFDSDDPTDIVRWLQDEPSDERIDACLKLLALLQMDFEPTSIYFGNRGPALVGRLGRNGYEVAIGADFPLSSNQHIRRILTAADPAAEDFTDYRVMEIAGALDNLALLVCPPPAPDENAVEYLKRLQDRFTYLEDQR